MAVQREAIAAALFARLSSVTEWKYTSRYDLSMDDVAPSQLPALFMIGGPETPITVQEFPSMWRLLFNVAIYVGNDLGRLVSPDIMLNELLTAIETCLERQPTEPPSTQPHGYFINNPPGSFGTSLGGLCYGCQLAGTIEKYQGTIGGTAVALIPVEVLATA